ncbi:hypothetical protein [Salipaludibacillus neizhouensis]|nr:hypothetical protein [Salipaludibacillus neizhouensis]
MLDQEVAERVKDYQEDIDIRDSILGIAQKMAQQMLAELGTDRTKKWRYLRHFHLYASG